MGQLQTDTNPDVLEAIQAVTPELDTVEQEMRTADHDRDAVDCERESEEQMLKEAAMEQVWLVPPRASLCQNTPPPFTLRRTS